MNEADKCAACDYSRGAHDRYKDGTGKPYWGMCMDFIEKHPDYVTLSKAECKILHDLLKDWTVGPKARKVLNKLIGAE